MYVPEGPLYACVDVRLVTVPEYITLPRPNLSWVIHGLIPRPSLMMLMGQPKEGKSFLAADVARAVAGGTEYLGQPCEQGNVLYLQLDTSEAVWRDRLRRQSEAGIEFPPGFRLVHPEDAKQPLDILQADSRTWLKQLIVDAAPTLVIVDVLRELHRADENDSTQMKIVGDYLVEVFGQVAVLLVHHMRKVPADVSDPDPVSYGRGSSYITGKMDGYWMLHKGHLKVVSRFDEAVRYQAVQDEVGVWSFPGLAARASLRERLLSLCVERPDLSHAKLAVLAKARWGVSRPTYYRHMAGQSCAHTATRPPEQAPVGPSGAPDP